VDNQTRHALKTDSFAHATATSVNWMGAHRSSVVRWTLIATALVVVVIGGLIFCNVRSSAADKALNAALDVYSAPLAQPGAPAVAGTYSTGAERAKAANQQFAAVASQYGFTAAGTKAHYFVGLTSAELGQNGSAESELKIAAGSWDRNLANLAKLALAELYHQTARDAQAIEAYQQIADKPSKTVPAINAKLDLANLYDITGKKDQARKLWAEIKAADKDGLAGSVATQKLGK